MLDRARREQHLLLGRGEPGEDLGAEVGGQIGGREDLRRLPAAGRRRVGLRAEQAERGGPAAGETPDARDGIGAQLRVAAGDELVRLLVGEGEVVEADLGQRALEPSPRQAEQRIPARAEHDAEGVGRVAQHEVELREQSRRGEVLGAVQHQDERGGTIGEGLRDPHGQVPTGEVRSPPGAHGGHLHTGAAESRQDVEPERAGHVDIGVERHPGDRSGRGAGGHPVAHQDRLARAGRCAEQGDRPGGAGRHEVEQPPALHEGHGLRRRQEPPPQEWIRNRGLLHPVVRDRGTHRPNIRCASFPLVPDLERQDRRSQRPADRASPTLGGKQVIPHGWPSVVTARPPPRHRPASCRSGPSSSGGGSAAARRRAAPW